MLNKKSDDEKGPLAKAIAQQSAEWLEANYPEVFDALLQELQFGRTLEDIRQILRRIFGYEMREPFVLRILQTAEFFIKEKDQR